MDAFPRLNPPPSLAEQAYAAVKALIFDFMLMPGDHFSESDLARQLEVSRTPLRQALQRLQREGFLQVFPKQGWQVAPLDFDAFDELYDLRVLLECAAVQRLCDLEDRPGLQALAALWLLPENERLRDGVQVGLQDEAFHRALVAGSGNREMVRVHAEITERIRIIRRLDFTQTARIAATYDEHARILGAITRRRSDEAQRLLRAHIAQSKLEVRRITLERLYRAREQAGLGCKLARQADGSLA
ncbi:DNA-binding transcriptional regulator, GntR family [Sphaerotilus natans]|uniref:GntR family transcriptional regulator n=2 Tax=Sphaerotilus natans TaxID=34103 RepID=UPI0009542B6B|nr:GntR family transcriptional regulator [Sphaerotilus natans]SIR80553.1 DNA-binding transcriptional regulator, GntR family [Sphaerotilus natans]